MKNKVFLKLIMIAIAVSSFGTLVAAETGGENAASSNLFSTVQQGGIMMIPVLLLGLAGTTIIIERIIFFLRTSSYKKEKLKEFLVAKTQQSKAGFAEELEDELRNHAQIYAARMEKGLGLLNGIGNLAPLLGFFGTVVGMIDAFAAIAAATTVNAKVVAVGIQIALVTTAGGLAVAVPTLAFYYFFLHFIQRIYAHSDEIIAENGRSLPRITSSQNTVG